jgi:hypothetical protein
VELASSMAMARAVGWLYTKVAGRESPVARPSSRQSSIEPVPVPARPAVNVMLVMMRMHLCSRWPHLESQCPLVPEACLGGQPSPPLR